MESFFADILKLFVQILFLLGAALVVVWFFFRMKQAQRPLAVPASNQDHSYAFTIRLQACERLILFLERISLHQLILRVHTGHLTVSQLEQLLVKTVRDEYEYNLSQQLYVSSATWDKIRHVHDDTIRLIHAVASRLSPEANGSDLSGQLVRETFATGKGLGLDAIEAVKNEVRSH